MVPMKMREQELDLQAGAGEFILQMQAQFTRAGSGIDDDHGFSNPYLHAGRVASIAEVVLHGNRDRPAHTPKRQSHPHG